KTCPRAPRPRGRRPATSRPAFCRSRSSRRSGAAIACPSACWCSRRFWESGQQLPRATAARAPVASGGYRRHERGRDARLRRREPAVAGEHAQGRGARCPPEPPQEVRGGHDAPQRRHGRGNGRRRFRESVGVQQGARVAHRGAAGERRLGRPHRNPHIPTLPFFRHRLPNCRRPLLAA
ncbi:unnamed protein product, partial [Ectocarpus fasciculatus]